MDDVHIAFIILPHSPHVNPTLPIVAALIRRGYRVTYVTSERFAAAVARVQAEVVLCERFCLDGNAGEDRQSRASDDTFCAYSRRMLESIVSFYDHNRPNLIVYDFMALAGRILARRLGIPAIQTSPFYAFDDGEFESQVAHAGFRDELMESAKTVASFLAEYGVGSENYRVDKEKLNIYLLPRALQPGSDRFGENCYFAGRCAAERVPTGKWERNTGGRRVALVAMSTLLSASTGEVQPPEYFKFCLEGLPSLGWYVVLSIGERCNPMSLQPLPPYCEIIQHTSYIGVLAQAQLLIFMSGIISTSEAAYHGVPMLAVTEGGGEYEWQADHLVNLGIGAHLRKAETNVENLRDAASRLVNDPKTVHRVRELQRLVRSEPGGNEAADRIELYLRQSG